MKEANLVETNVVGQAASADGIQQSEGAQTINVALPEI
jgi:hypothetical protein